MPVKIIYTEDGGIIYEGSGVLTDNDLDKVSKEGYQDDERIKQISYQIFDSSNIESVDVSNERVLRNAEMDKRALNINPRMRLAILAKSDLEFGLGRMWETYTCEMSGYENSCSIFRNRDDLNKWIRSEAKKP
jgi:hypothetical protein